jgi:hypothetical protein
VKSNFRIARGRQTADNTFNVSLTSFWYGLTYCKESLKILGRIFQAKLKALLYNHSNLLGDNDKWVFRPGQSPGIDKKTECASNLSLFAPFVFTGFS